MSRRGLADRELNFGDGLGIADHRIEMLFDQHLAAQRFILQRQPRPRFFQLLVQPRVFDRDRGLVGECFDERQILL